MEKKTFTLLYVISHSLGWLMLTDARWSFPDGVRFAFFKALPIVMFVLLFYREEIKQAYKIPNLRELFDTSKFLCLYLSVAIGFYAFINRPDLNLIGVSWSWYALATWGFSFPLFYLVLKRNFKSYESFILAFLFCKLAGFLYEVPIYSYMDMHVGIYYHLSHPFIVNFDYFLLPSLILYIRKRHKVTVKPLCFFSTFLYVGFSMFYFWHKNITILPIHRLPTIFMLLVWVYYIGKKR